MKYCYFYSMEQRGGLREAVATMDYRNYISLDQYGKFNVGDKLCMKACPTLCYDVLGIYKNLIEVFVVLQCYSSNGYICSQKFTTWHYSSAARELMFQH